MHRPFLTTSFILGAASVALGAFGAHGLKSVLSAQQLITFETAVRYQFYHVFALALVAILYKEFPNKRIYAAGCFFIAGIVLFCGSLYALCYVQAAQISGFKWLGPVTPLGGVMFILGWIMMAAGVFKKN